jgi:serine/threonine protein kinase
MSITNSNESRKDTRPVGRVVTMPRTPLPPDTVLQGRYSIVKHLCKGGMGAVYEAVDQRLDATVALKETFAVDERLRRQFEQEARLLAQLNHPALPRVSDYFTEGDRSFLVMQFIGGVDLAEIIASQPGPFPRNQVVAWADQLLDALIFLHSRERQIIHRDIKPHNLKLTANGTIALLDFGLAKAEAADKTSDKSVSGFTRRYAPIEQIQDHGTTPRSDIYALGATLYHLLTGTKPVDAVVRAAALESGKDDPLRPANEVHAAVGVELAQILMRAMAQNPANRFESAREFREALARLGRKQQDEEFLKPEVISTHFIHEPKNKPERTHNGGGFDGYSILKPEERALFSAPQSNRSTGIVIAILLLLLTGLVVTLYGYRRLSESAAPAPAPKAGSGQHLQQPNTSQSKLGLSPSTSRENCEAISLVATRLVVLSQ